MLSAIEIPARDLRPGDDVSIGGAWVKLRSVTVCFGTNVRYEKEPGGLWFSHRYEIGDVVKVRRGGENDGEKIE